MGRPEVDVDERIVEELAALFCPVVEIAAVVGCSRETLYNDRFSTIIDKGRQRGRMSLRKKQFEAANNGNVVMLIWLGKQYLDQQDKTQISLEKISDEILIGEAQRRLTDGSKP